MKKEMSAALIIRRGRVLLVHNAKHGGLRIEPPGGKKKEGEGWHESVVREAAEELGIEVRPIRLFGTYDTHSPEGEFTVRLYLSEIVSGEPKVMEPEKIPGFGWYSVEEMVLLGRNERLVPNMVLALEDIRSYLATGPGEGKE